MTARRRLAPAFATFCALIALAVPAARAAVVHQVTWDGPVTPVTAEFLVTSIEAAAREGAEAILVLLDTPGGLDTSMRDIVKAELESPVPVIMYVAPSGSRAASAGAFLTLAAHVAAMAPGTNIGSASPVRMGGASMDSTMAHKVTNDAAAYLASIAADKGRNAEEARAFVTRATNLTADEALARNVIDLVAASVPALLDSLQGRTVTAAGREVVLQTADAVIEVREMSARQRFLKALADPNLAYILMMLGIYGLFFELSNPGTLVPGILGGICLLLALFAFQALPVDYTGAALILLGVIMLLLEIKVTSFGALGIGGTAAMVFGSLMLFDASADWARLSLKVMVPTLALTVAFLVLCVVLVVRSRRRPVATGRGALVGETGVLMQPVDGAGGLGKVTLLGEIWDARADVALAAGVRVRITAVEGRALKVEAAGGGKGPPTAAN